MTLNCLLVGSRWVEEDGDSHHCTRTPRFRQSSPAAILPWSPPSLLRVNEKYEGLPRCKGFGSSSSCRKGPSSSSQSTGGMGVDGHLRLGFGLLGFVREKCMWGWRCAKSNLAMYTKVFL